MSGEPVVNQMEIMIEWGDCDPAGIVYYPRYSVYFDNAANALMAKVGQPKHEVMERYGLFGMPMVETRVKFSIPSRWGEKAVIESYVQEWRRSSFVTHHRLLKDGKVAVEGWDTRVWTERDPDNPGRIRSRAIPPEFIAAYGGVPAETSQG
jgi:4-hydroxybenzoyl-CoA thioesterase